jgi:hypothetical protein
MTLISIILSEGGVFERNDIVDFEGFKARLATIFFKRFC